MSNNKELLKAIENYEKPKISVVMQVFLGDYPGARSNPIEKFKRAVKSFQEQTYKNSELIIVADGCLKTQQIYQRTFQNEENIKFVYIDKKSGLNMYEDHIIDGQTYKYYRGTARKIGVAAATGDLITYMDGDDYLLPQHLLTIMLNYNQHPDGDWWINRSWYDHATANWNENDIMYSTINADTVEFDEFKNQKWTPVKLKENQVILSPWLFVHRATCNTKWRDTIGVSEDVDFNKRLRAEYPKGFPFERPTYIRCHYTNKWDV